MSEFQCYQFKSIDRPLSDSEYREVSALSSRGQVSRHSATFIYHYSDFRHNPATVLEKYFDAMLYFSNWGTRRLMFRLPAELPDAKAIAKYCWSHEYGGGSIGLEQRGGCYLLEIEFNDEEGGGWMEDDDFDIADLAPLRDDITDGDYRALYLAWASFTQQAAEEIDEEEEEEEEDREAPPVPAGLKHPTAALQAFIGFFDIDPDLVAAAQAASPAGQSREVDHQGLLRRLPEEERIAWLSRLLSGEPQLGRLLKKRLEELSPRPAAAAQPTFTAAELGRLSTEKKAERKAREEAEARAAHEKRMKALAKQEPDLWKSVVFNLERKTGKSYDLATETLKDLKALAAFQQKEAAFQAKMLELRKEYFRRSSLIERWEKAGLFKSK